MHHSLDWMVCIYFSLHGMIDVWTQIVYMVNTVAKLNVNISISYLERFGDGDASQIGLDLDEVSP